VTQVRLEQDVALMRTYQEALDTAPFVMVVLSATVDNYRILYANKPVTEKLGYEVANLLGR
jgi:PAS domain-containing protein